ncbi:SDR family oxidoreductase [Nocardioides zeae]|uniref:SDR family oxidoreductase n=1 Tax=Nocardioides imazamoxiresistens TaxID=3231893 RepID=A0ABU3PSC0_9ACTN|nr:SDR family oxidoreductase [Nocardioides zeae]MDT9592079.1 SDR family oxidoreductase [Nocardioides zeae]
MALIGVTGATGAVGGLIARDLAERGVAQRLLVRDPGRAPDLPGAEPRTCDYATPDAAALQGVSTLLMVSAGESADRVAAHRALVGAAAEAGVRHVVYTSFVGASPTSTFTLARDHHATERAIDEAGLARTFLRDNFYLDLLPHFVGDDDVLRGPAGDGRVAAVARADVARAAVVALLDPAAHAGAIYDLTGPEALTLDEVAARVASATGRPVRFHDETDEEAYASRRRWEAPQWQYDAWVSTYTAIRAGELAAVSDDVRRVTGREPLSLADVLAG